MAALRSNTEDGLKINTESENLTSCPLPGDVLCDSCLDSPNKALKSCMTCLVSYCEVHLRPHLANSKFQNHRLVDPLHDITGQTCQLHHLPLLRFCLIDSCCVCLDCESQQHEGHPTASVGEARVQIEAELENKCKEISESASEAEKAIGNLQSNHNLIKLSVQDVRVIVEQQFVRLQTAVDEARKAAVEVLKGEKRQALRQTESIQAHLEQRRAELFRTLAVMNKLPRNKSDVDFLQEYSEWKKGISDLSLPTVDINHMDQLTSYAQVVTDTTQELCELIVSSYKDKMNLTSKSGDCTKSAMPKPYPLSLPDPETREDFLKYTRSLTFDPNTTHHFLRVMEDSRKLLNTSPWQHCYPDHPHRFDYWHQAMTSESLYQGRHYIEAELSGEGAHVGLAFKGIDRKGQQITSCITNSDFSWCMGSNSRGFFAWHANVGTPLSVSDITRVGLYVDFQRGSLRFYDVTGDEVLRLLHEYRADLLEPLYVTALLSENNSFIHLANKK